MKPIKIIERLHESTWCGVPDTIYRYHGDWSDPEVEYKGKLYNEWDLQEYIGEAFNDYCRENNIDVQPLVWAEKFSEWLEKNPDYAYQAFDELEPVDKIEESIDTSEYYGGTYPEPPKSYWGDEDEDKPTDEEIENHEWEDADNYNDDVKLGMYESDKQLSFDEIVIDSANHFLRDLGETPSIDDIYDDILHNYEQEFITEDDDQKAVEQNIRDIKYVLRKNGYKEGSDYVVESNA